MSGADQPLVRSRRHFYQVWTAVGVVALLWATWQLLSHPARYVLPPVLFAAVIVYLFNPAVTALQRWHIPRFIGTLTTYLAATTLLAGATWLFIPTFLSQTAAFADQLPELAVDLQDTINSLLGQAGLNVEISLDPHAEETRRYISQWLTGSSGDIGTWLQRVASVAGVVAEVTITLIVGPVVAFYLLLDLPTQKAQLRRWIPALWVEEVADVASRVGSSVARYIRGQLLLATAVGVMTTAAAAAVSLPYFAVVGVFAGITNLVPMLGPWVGGLFGVSLALTVGDGITQAVLFAALVVVIQQIDSNLLSPAVVGRAVSLHPATVALTLLAAAAAGGLPAMIVAIPAVATTKLVVLHIVSSHTRWGRNATAPTGHIGNVGPVVADAAEPAATTPPHTSGPGPNT